MKLKYKPERQKLSDGIWFSHGENLLGKHVDTILKIESIRYSKGATETIKYLRPATKTEKIEHCV